MKAALQARQRELAEREAAALAAHAAAQRERELFARSVGTVARLRDRGLAELERGRPQPHPVQRERDEEAALRAALSDELDVESLLQTDENLSFLRQGVAPDTLRRLRRGEWAIQAHLDLHGLRRDAARDRLAGFLREACKAGLRCVRVVHGKGHGSPGRMPVLKAKVRGWLVQSQEVMAFTQARPVDGGAGALLVLLASR